MSVILYKRFKEARRYEHEATKAFQMHCDSVRRTRRLIRDGNSPKPKGLVASHKRDLKYLGDELNRLLYDYLNRKDFDLSISILELRHKRDMLRLNIKSAMKAPLF